MKIDFHCHSFPEAYLKKLKAYYPEKVDLKENAEGRKRAIWSGTPLTAWDQRQRLEEMDACGVDIEILSTPTAYTVVDERSPELCSLLNDSFVDISRKNPGRFKAFATIPFNDMDEAVKELKRITDQPGMVGVFITSNIGGRYLNIPEFLPFWEEVNRLKLPVFLHPIEPPGYQDDDIAPLAAFPAETTLAAMKMVYGGLFEKFREIKLILAHLGGSLPFLARRLDLGFEVAAFPEKYRQHISIRPSEYFKEFYYDTALGWHRPALECTLAFAGVDHIVYGTDHFIPNTDFMSRTTSSIESLELTDNDKGKIYSGNGRRILTLTEKLLEETEP